MNDEIENEEAGLNPKHRGLGRGLNALFEDEESVAPHVAGGAVSGAVAGKSRTLLSVDLLEPNANQPRRLFADDSLHELADSIKEYGVLQPLLVRPLEGHPGGYQIIAGERRWRAAQIAQLHEVPVIITDYDDQKTQEIALIENLQREDLNPIDEAAGYKYMMDEYGYTQEHLAKKMGKSRPHITNTLRLNALPEAVAVHLANGAITMGHARALLGVDNAAKLCEEVVENGISVRDTEKMVGRIKARAAGKDVAPSSKTSPEEFVADMGNILSEAEAVVAEFQNQPKSANNAGKAAGKDEDTIALERDLSNSLGMNVVIDSRGGGAAGELRISYKSLDQLDELLKKLSAHGGGVRLDG